MSFGFLIYPGVEELDFQGPWEMVGMWHKYAGGPAPCLVARNLDPVRCAHGMRVLPDIDFTSGNRFSQLLIPGGFAAFTEMHQADICDFVRQHAQAGTTLMSVCSGSFILLGANVLSGRRASTNWKVIEKLREAGIDVVEERYTHDGSVWTSAGVSAGIDMVLAYIAFTHGEDVASLVQLNAEYFPEGRIYGHERQTQPVPTYVTRT
jgi:transcriptional regulator GlxA family with amidase domain